MGMSRRYAAGAASQEDTATTALAVGAIRCAFHAARSCSVAPRSRPALVEDLRHIAASFRHAHERMIEVQGWGLLVAVHGTVRLTRHEHLLLGATAAAQAEDDQGVDGHLFKLAPRTEVRPHLAHAVTFLATGLAIAGHWLPSLVVPAPALAVARLHGLDPQDLTVAWPHAHGR